MKDFNYFGKKNFLITIATLLVVAMGYMALTTYKRPMEPKQLTYEEQIEKIEYQSESDSIDSIEADLKETNLNDVDKELQDIDAEVNSPSN